MRYALSLSRPQALCSFCWRRVRSSAVAGCWMACSARGASRRSFEVGHGEPAEDEAELRREAARGIAELEHWLVAQPPQAQDPGDPA